MTLQRIRAAVTVGILWSTLWALTGVGIATWQVIFHPPYLASPFAMWSRAALRGAVVLGICGFSAGLMFALGLSKATGATTVDGLSLGRSVRLGALAGAATILVFPLVGMTHIGPILVSGVITAVVGAASALATIVAARRAMAPNA